MFYEVNDETMRTLTKVRCGGRKLDTTSPPVNLVFNNWADVSALEYLPLSSSTSSTTEQAYASGQSDYLLETASGMLADIGSNFYDWKYP